MRSLAISNKNGCLSRIGRYIGDVMKDLGECSKRFYQQSLRLLQESELPFLVGGAYAFCLYTGITRDTKDFDLFVRRNDFEKTLRIFADAGFRSEKTFPHWLGKVFGEGHSIDIIYRAGNGLCPVDDLWFERAPKGQLFGIPVRLTPPEEMIWMKAYIMERERYDGADVAHLFFHCASEIDWSHLLQCFGPDWRLLLSHLILFGFIYPSHRNRIPTDLFENLIQRLRDDVAENNDEPPVCYGTLLSRIQFLPDVETGNFRDARLQRRSGLSQPELDTWTAAAGLKAQPYSIPEQD